MVSENLLDVNFLLNLNLPKGGYLGNDLFKNVISIIVVFFNQAVFNLFCSFSTFFSDFPSEKKKSKNEKKKFPSKSCKTHEKADFYQTLDCTAPKPWSKYTTQTIPFTLFSPQTPPHINRIFIS